MNFSIKNVDESSLMGNQVSKYVNYQDGPLDLKLRNIELKKANSGSFMPIMHMESRPIEDSRFVPMEGYTGKSAKIRGSRVYLKTDEQMQNFCNKLGRIASSMGCLNELKQIEEATFEGWVSKAENILKGKFARFTFGVEEYINASKNNEIGWNIYFPDYNFVESCDAPNTLTKVDPNDPKRYKKAEAPVQIESFGVSTPSDDLPF